MLSKIIFLCGLFVFCGSSAFGQKASISPSAALTFERDVRPVLKEYCFDCHGATDDKKGGLDLRLRRWMVRGGEYGVAIVPGKPGESYLIERLRAGEMPPGEKKVPEEDIDRLEKWISLGAPTARPEPDKLEAGVGITPEERAWWSFQPIVRPQPPTFESLDDLPNVDKSPIRTPIDAFIFERLHNAGLAPADDADKLTLLKRVSFDLLGLPPNAGEIERFLADDSHDAYDKLIDRMLASKHYGERWGRHWLDAAGYADSEGYANADDERPWAYKYRDYVIASLNHDKPLDQFIQEQLAGDEMVGAPHQNLSPEAIEKITATGFLRMAADGTGSGANDDQARNQTIADTIKIVSTSLLGLSVGCAQCHDHRYDPILQRDYYQLRAVFEPALNWKNWRTPSQRRLSLYTEEDRKQVAEVEAEAQKIVAERAAKQQEYIAAALIEELKRHPEGMRPLLRAAYETPADKRTGRQNELLAQHPSVNISAGTLYQYNQKAADDLKKYDQRIAEVRKKKPVEEFLRALIEPAGNVPSTHLFHRGEFQQPKEAVLPAALSIASPPDQRFTIEANNAGLPTTGRRTAYAKWLTSGKHPLTARVLVNRIWMHHFGRGLVGTPADFGVLGEKPTHPQLLDWLADELMSGGWRLKRMHKLIMTSSVYRQSAVRASTDDRMAGYSTDASNTLYWKYPVQRLDAELVRDRILAVAGVLTDKLYGPPMPIKTDDAGQVIVDGGQTRRSLYIRVKRTQPLAMLKTFDAPVMETNCDRRASSTTAIQSLMLMNSDFVLRHAKKFAQRVRREASKQSAPLPEFAAFEQQENQFSGIAAPVWSFGYGEYQEAAGRLGDLNPFPHWTGSSWQGGGQLPDPKIGWAHVNADGGHPGKPPFASIRRWTAPHSGVASLKATMRHFSEQGDGVRGRVIHNQSKSCGEWTVQHNQLETNLDQLKINQGDTLDFIVDCRSEETYDSFHWLITLEMKSNENKLLGKWESRTGFHGPTPTPPPLVQQIACAWRLGYCRPPTAREIRQSLQFVQQQIQHLEVTGVKNKDTDPQLQAMTNLCQTLMSSNEFLYID